MTVSLATGAIASLDPGRTLSQATPAATPTPTPGVGVGELVDYWPLVRRAGWFLLGFLVVVGVGRFVIEPAVTRAVRLRNRNNPTIREAVRRYVRLFVALLGVILGVTLAGFGHVLADSALVVAAATLTVGVAAQTVLGSLVSGVVLVIDPEFNVGDYIEWPGGEGTVQSITLRVTRVLTPNGELITVPNTTLTGEAITRPYSRGRYRVVDHVAVAYEDDVDEAMALLVEATDDVEDIADAPSPDAKVEEFGPDAVVLSVYYWIANPRRADVIAVRSEYARAAKERLEEADITVSPPSKRELLGRIGVADGG
ncbi:MAG: mechanosensitive ion channel family protein [Haloarculaceae archaeon]